MDIQPDPPTISSRLLPDSASFEDNALRIANHSIPDLVQKFGTPLYIYDRATIVNACASYFHAFQEFYHVSSF